MQTATMAGDRERVAQLLGRAPQGDFTVAVRDRSGDPVVIRNAPLLTDGTPMPTRYWLVGPDAVRAVSRLEADGGVRTAESAVDADELAAAHARYARERQEALPSRHEGPSPAGGVGGTRQGVKCLHAHYAWYLAGGDDPVGRWVADRLGDTATWITEPAQNEPDGRRERAPEPRREAISMTDLHVTVEAGAVHLEVADAERITLDVGPESLTAEELAGHDPPRPEQLTNALGAVADQLENVIMQSPDIAEIGTLVFAGDDPVALARVEAGTDHVTRPAVIGRDDIEEVFRTVATEPTVDRSANPGLEPQRVDTIVATCCIVLTLARRFDLDSVTVA